MANRYWVGGTATWDGTAGTKWATTSGGGGGAAVPTASDDVFFDAASGTVTVTQGTGSCLSLNFTGFTGTWSGSGELSISGSITLAAGMTRSYIGTINFIATSGTKTITSNGKAFAGIINFNGSGGTFQLADAFQNNYAGTGLNLLAGTFSANGQTVTITGNNSGVSSGFTGSNAFYNLTKTGSAGKTDTFNLSGDLEVTNTLTINGNSTVNRILVGNLSGTVRTITAATLVTSNTDWRCVTAAGAASWNLSAITGNSGDCGGNTGITFTTAATQTATGTASFTWSTHGWTSRVPLPQDDVVINNAFIAGRTITADMPRLGKSITCSCTGSPTFRHTTVVNVFGSVDLTGITTFTSTTSSFNFCGVGSTTFKSAGLNINCPLGISLSSSGDLTLSDNLSVGTATARTLTHTSGNLKLNTKDLTLFGVYSIVGTISKTLTGSGNLILTLNTASTLLNATGSNFSTSGSYTIKYTSTAAVTQTFAGNGLIFSNVWFDRGASTGGITITGANTFAEFKDTGTATHTITFPNSTTTVTSWNVNGTAGNLITLQRTGASGNWTISDTTGTNASSYISISNSIATGGATWNANDGTSTNGGGNTGWNFPTPSFNPSPLMHIMAQSGGLL